MRAVALLTAAALTAAGAAFPSPAPAAERPNIVLITADDMTDYDPKWMPNVKRLLRDQGTKVNDFIAAHPLCCPARAELFTGQYAHNNGVRHNTGPRGGWDAMVGGNNNLGAWLHADGYRTGMVGKFMNGYEGPHEPIPAGWDHWQAYIGGVYDPYGMTVHNNGNPVTIDGVHTNDYVSRETARFVESAAPDGPFFVWASYVAPHAMTLPDGSFGPPVPADRHKDLYANLASPAAGKPSFNERNVRDKPGYVRERRIDAARMQELFTARVRSNRSVDDGVRRLVDTLTAAGELDNTLIVFTSDNGNLLGEHRLRGKNYPYEEALQIPLYARGPGVPRGVTVRENASLVDLPATFLDVADAAPGRRQDGRSIMPILNGGDGYGTRLIQAGDAALPWLWRGVRNHRWTYVRHHTGEVELYDREADPWQETNVAGDRPATERRLSRALARLRGCAGVECR